MDLTGIFTIGGKPGLQKLVAKSANGVIVESLIDGKRFNAYSSYKISSLEDISIYCDNEDVPLSDVLLKIADKNDFKEVDIPLKGEFFNAVTVYVTIDQERVYESDIKKLFIWYNLLVKNDILTPKALKSSEEDENINLKEDEANEEKLNEKQKA
jgi:hypothetical protein